MEKNKFIKGKWYEYIYSSGNKYAMKCKDTVDRFQYSEYINITTETYGIDTSYLNFNKIGKEIPIEEIQQYLPKGHVDLIVEGFKLPEKWQIKLIKENTKILGDWRDSGYTGVLTDEIPTGYIYSFKNSQKGYWSNTKDKDYTEITFEQFKKYVLGSDDDIDKKLNKDELLEEAKRRYPKGTKYDSVGGFNGCVVKDIHSFKYNSDNIRTITDENNGSILYSKKKNKWAEIISTKWFVGSYVTVITKGHANGKTTEPLEIGNIFEISHSFEDEIIGVKSYSNCCKHSNFKWFATKTEAEEFAKTLTKTNNANEMKTNEKESWCVKVTKENEKLVSGINIKNMGKAEQGKKNTLSILDQWLVDTKAKNLSLYKLSAYIGNCPFDEVYMKLEGNQSKGKAKILYNQWNGQSKLNLVRGGIYANSIYYNGKNSLIIRYSSSSNIDKINTISRLFADSSGSCIEEPRYLGKLSNYKQATSEQMHKLEQLEESEGYVWDGAKLVKIDNLYELGGTAQPIVEPNPFEKVPIQLRTIKSIINKVN